jgi:hypothetical protein
MPPLQPTEHTPTLIPIARKPAITENSTTLSTELTRTVFGNSTPRFTTSNQVPSTSRSQFVPFKKFSDKDSIRNALGIQSSSSIRQNGSLSSDHSTAVLRASIDKKIPAPQTTNGHYPVVNVKRYIKRPQQQYSQQSYTVLPQHNGNVVWMNTKNQINDYSYGTVYQNGYDPQLQRRVINSPRIDSPINGFGLVQRPEYSPKQTAYRDHDYPLRYIRHPNNRDSIPDPTQNISYYQQYQN